MPLRAGVAGADDAVQIFGENRIVGGFDDGCQIRVCGARDDVVRFVEFRLQYRC
jgi:hypothetical protein